MFTTIIIELWKIVLFMVHRLTKNNSDYFYDYGKLAIQNKFIRLISMPFIQSRLPKDIWQF